ncbi:MAG: TIGR02221 family CRISPR-associated protein [Deferribacteraceae bacterium]|jgi:CRISPR-associated Csx2 family protein|nr:TIGR02221 family CRISPR-associated protein [Deferribacteraceae bacterium]
MAKHFISFLGTGGPGGYREVSYDGGEKTKFAQIEIIRRHCSEFTLNDKFTIFLTKGARERSWQGLTAELNGLNLQNLPRFGDKDICDGATEEELWQIFENIYETIAADDEVIFDITHGFRFLPILAIVALNYARTLTNFTLRKFYYGAIDDYNNNIGSIRDLSMFDDILQWSYASNDFNKYGVSAEIVKMLTKNKIKSNPIKNISNVLATVRGQKIVEGEVFQRCKKSLSDYKLSENHSPQIDRVLGLVEEKLDATSGSRRVHERHSDLNCGYVKLCGESF